MKTILIPTDFTYDSLAQIAAAPQAFPKDKLRVLLIHFIKMSDSITEMLLLSHRTREQKLITPQFVLWCDDIRREYGSHIQAIHPDFFYGSTAAMFQDFVEANSVSAIVYDGQYRFRKACKNSTDPVRLITRAGVPLIDTQKLPVKTAAAKDEAADHPLFDPAYSTSYSH